MKTGKKLGNGQFLTREKEVMTCSDCVNFYRDQKKSDNLRNTNAFIFGSINFRTSAIDDELFNSSCYELDCEIKD